MKNETNYTRYWLAVILVSAIISLLSCTTVREAEYTEQSFDGGLFEENDTVVNVILYTFGNVINNHII